MIFCVTLGLKSPYESFFLSFFCLIKLFSHENLGFILFFVLSLFYRLFGLSSACYYMVLFVVLLRCFIYVRAIQTCKEDLINQIYQIIVVSMFQN